MEKKKIIFVLAIVMLIVIFIFVLNILSSDKGDNEKQDDTSDFVADSTCMTTIVDETTRGLETETIENVFGDNSSSNDNMPSKSNKNEDGNHKLSNSDNDIDTDKENKTVSVESTQEESTDLSYIQNETDNSDVTYEMYCNMSSKQQKKFFESFESANDFFDWYNKAKEKYDSMNDEIEIDDEQVILGK